MSIWYSVLGAAVLLLAVVDLVWTTLSASGGGPVSRYLGKVIWQATGKAPFAGPLILAATAAAWVGLLWAGWTLVFMGAADAVVSASTGVPAGFWERVYFGGYTVATLGLGDFVPDGPVWRVFTVLCVLSGLVLITLAVTYYTAVLGAVVQKQQFGELVRTLGDSPAGIVAGAWDGESFEGLDTVLSSLASLLALHTRRHYAYPVIHYFRTSEPEAALAVQSARLGDALVLLQRVVDEGHRPPPVSTRMAWRGLRTFLETLDLNFVTAAPDAPPLPDVSRMQEAGVPMGRDMSAAFASDEVREERRTLLGFVHESRFNWPDVDPGAEQREA